MESYLSEMGSASEKPLIYLSYLQEKDKVYHFLSVLWGIL